MAYTGMAIADRCLYSCGLYSYGLYSYGLYSYGLYSYGLCSYGLYSYGLCSYGLHSYGLYSYGLGFGWGQGFAANAPWCLCGLGTWLPFFGSDGSMPASPINTSVSNPAMSSSSLLWGP